MSNLPEEPHQPPSEFLTLETESATSMGQWHSLNQNDVLLFSQNETYLVGGYQEKIQQTIVNTLSGDLYESFKSIRDKANSPIRGGMTSGKVKLLTQSEEIPCQTLRVEANQQGWKKGLLKVEVETFFEFAADHYDVNFEVTVILGFSPTAEELP